MLGSQENENVYNQWLPSHILTLLNGRGLQAKSFHHCFLLTLFTPGTSACSHFWYAIFPFPHLRLRAPLSLFPNILPFDYSVKWEKVMSQEQPCPRGQRGNNNKNKKYSAEHQRVVFTRQNRRTAAACSLGQTGRQGVISVAEKEVVANAWRTHLALRTEARHGVSVPSFRRSNCGSPPPRSLPLPPLPSGNDESAVKHD